MSKRELTFVSGLYFYTRNGQTSYPKKSISELEKSLQINSWYKDTLICYADTKEMAEILSDNGLYVHKVFDDAPQEIKNDSAHKMKHWIMLNAAKKFNDVVWIDWDTYSLKLIDEIDFKEITTNTYFLHLKNFEMLNSLNKKENEFTR